ncbi:unnamed protein product [Strongylus vulgaris]|uniref:Uncharacterized protein n=1 Tax=Strongylus vulgaris TaxID=40348 RepID=A0A3P7K7W1_STRVU|nr:unnamed protein product [Strongylus vulgaris]
MLSAEYGVGKAPALLLKLLLPWLLPKVSIAYTSTDLLVRPYNWYWLSFVGDVMQPGSQSSEMQVIR